MKKVIDSDISISYTETDRFDMETLQRGGGGMSNGRRRVPYLKFKAFLVENNISQSELARLLGKSKSAVNQNINGTGGDFSLEEVRLICQKYNISADEYFLYPHVSESKREEGASAITTN